MTILMVTHNQVIPEMMKKNFVMKDGNIVEYGINENEEIHAFQLFLYRRFGIIFLWYVHLIKEERKGLSVLPFGLLKGIESL